MMILIKLNNDRNNLHTFIEDISVSIYRNKSILYFIYTSFYIDSG